MSVQRVQATISVKSEQFQQSLEEAVLNSSTNEPSASYEGLIAANERLKSNLSKILTEYVNKARLEHEANGNQNKRKIEHDDDNDEEQDEEEDPGSSDDNEEEQD